MATEKYTTPSSVSCEIRDGTLPSLDRDLPEAGSFHSVPPRISLAQMIQRNRQLRQWFPSRLRSAAERWQAKTIAEFHL